MKKLLAIFSTIAMALAVLTFTPVAANAALKTQTATVTLSGTPMVSGTLFADIAGLKSGSAIKYTWKVDGVTQGTEESFYLGNSEFAGATIKLYISAKKSGYKEWKYTSPNIVEGEVSQLKAGSISGSLLTGYQLEANCGTFLPAIGSAESSSVCEVQWQKNGQDIDGATGATLELTSEDIGFHISAIITVTANGVYGIEKSLTKSGVVIGSFDVSEAPTFTSGALVGDNVSFESYPAWSIQPSSTKYQWYRSGKKISGATSSNYTLKSDDWHKSVTLKITVARANYATQTFSFDAVPYVYKIITKSGVTKSGYYAWDSCDVNAGDEVENWDYYDDVQADQYCYSSNSSKYANGYSYNNEGGTDYTHMNFSMDTVVDPDLILDWRAVITGSVTSSLDVYVGTATAEGVDYADWDNGAWQYSSGTWKTPWSTIAPDADYGLFNFYVYAGDEEISNYGTFTVKTVKIEVRYVG